jgi:methylisocitrate lyase
MMDTSRSAVDSPVTSNAFVIPSVWDIPSAVAARHSGASTLFLSGGALSAAIGVPDIGLVGSAELTEVARRIVTTTRLPLMVDGETGYGSLAALARLIESLADVGVTSVMLEDQEETGQSVRRNPGLCSPSTMTSRLKTAKEVAGGRIQFLARTDILDRSWPLADSLGRLEMYLEAGADWILPVFVRSYAELTEFAALGENRCVAIAVKGATGYVPTLQDAQNAGCRGILVTSQNLAVFANLLRLYDLSLAGAFDELINLQVDRAEFGKHMGFERYTRWSDQTL